MLAAEVADAATPLGGPFVIPYALTGGDQVAAGPGDAVQQPRLAVECHRGGLVKAAHALVQLAVAHQCTAFESEPEHLQLGGAECAPKLDRLRGQLPCLGRVLGERHGDVAFVDGEPAVIDARLEVVDQAVCSLQPSVRDGRFAAEHEAVRGEQRCDPGRRAAVSPVEVLAVCALAGVDRQPLLAQHMAGPADPLERLWGLSVSKATLERGSGSCPVAAPEGGPPRV